MHMMKLVLPLAGLLMAGQVLAHKASHDHARTPAPAGPALAQVGIHPVALLDGAGGRSSRPTSAMPAADAAQPIGKKHKYTLTH